MNTNQWVAFRALRSQVNDIEANRAAGRLPHIISEARSPLYRGVTCSCGWTFRTVRRQNRLAQGSKIEAAVRAHFEYVLSTRQPPAP